MNDHLSRANGQLETGRTIMVQGTASDAGKSLLAAALCRIFAQDGYRTAPFKSQNMSLNSYVTWDGKEIGRAQGMQADACGILASTDMNPILLKPTKEMSSQVVVHGRPLGEWEARAYRESYLPKAGEIVRQALGRLRDEYEIVVLEGAGSPAEINLKDRDIVNMRMAAWADAPVILVADIDRGGVFASIVGTLELLEPHERDRICGFVINKFRGDVSLLQPGLDWLQNRTGKPVIGVMPFLPGLELEDEDSLSMRTLGETPAASASSEQPELDIAVIQLPRISNFTDVDPLRHESDVRLRFVDSPRNWGNPDVVILPGSKNTIEDLIWIREQGLSSLLEAHLQKGGRAVGLCGGYEMFGEKLSDPHGVESAVSSIHGIGVFPFEVTFARQKRTVRVEGEGKLHDDSPVFAIEGYEIHMGMLHTRSGEMKRPFLIREKRWNEAMPGKGANHFAEGACTADGRIWGTFIHGILHNDAFRRNWLNDIRIEKGLSPIHDIINFQERREAAFDRLAEAARKHLDIPFLYQVMGMTEESEK
ncbi:cobyric acid synthase [Paenibacillus sp. GCM10027627]|uniref:cobyric acid synthase n=1 Tax=unclassified Paenibacillus TaxID=185978 RepID=UPI00362D7E11